MILDNAKVVLPDAVEITEVRVSTKLLVIRLPASFPIDGVRELRHELRARLQSESLPPVLVLCGDELRIEELPETMMNDLGWYRREQVQWGQVQG